MDRIKENEIYDKFQDLCNSHKEISHFGDKHLCNTECPLRDTNRCESVFFYQQGKVDGAREFAEWIHKYLGNSNTVLYTYRQSPVGFTFVDKKSVDEILSEWKKEVNNAE